MKRYLVAALLAACVAAPLSGCGTFSLQTPEQALTAAHQTHDGLAQELDLAAKSGLIKGGAAATAAQYLAESETYLVDADNAFAAGQSINALLDQANADIAKVKPLIPTGSK